MKRQLFVMLAIVFAVVLTSNIVIETVVSKESYLVYEEPPLIDIGFLLLAYSFSSHVFRLPFTVFFMHAGVPGAAVSGAALHGRHQ